MKPGILNKTYKNFLFISSFLPLYIFLLIKNVDIAKHFEDLKGEENNLITFFSNCKSPEMFFWLTIFLLIAISIITIIGFFFLYVKDEGVSGTVSGQSFERSDTLGYIVTYIVPLLSMDITSFRSLIINFLLFFIIGVLYVRNNQFYMNPVFTLMGYNILASNSGSIYITKLSPIKIKELAQDSTQVAIKNISENIYVITELD